jgi:hypothetical protein
VVKKAGRLRFIRYILKGGCYILYVIHFIGYGFSYMSKIERQTEKYMKVYCEIPS